MMMLPDYYTRFYIRFMRYSIVMTLVALLSGILMQESEKKTPYSPLLPAGIHWESIYHLALLHGHVFLIGVLIPLAILWMLHLGLILNRQPVSENLLTWGSRLYLPSAATAIGLMLYKGYHYIISVRLGQMDFQTIEHNYFMGLKFMRYMVYGLTHTVMAIGLSILVIGVWKSLGKPRQEA